MQEGTLHKWFKNSKSKDGKSGWVNVVTGGTCASDEPGEGTPKCVSSSKRASMSKAERLSAQRRKKKADPGQQQKSGAAKPTYVSTDKPKKKMKEEASCPVCGFDPCQCLEGTISEEDKKGKGSGKKDACYRKVKASAKVWPSAYASGRLVQCRKKGAANYGNSKNESYNYSNWRDEFKALEIESIDLIKPEPLKGVEIDEKCWQGYTQKGMKKKGKKIVPNCVPVGEESEVPSGNIKKLAKKAVKRVDTDADGDVDHNDKKKGKYGEFVPSADGKKRIYTGESYTIDASAHKKAQKREKIRSLVSKGVGGEKDVAKRKLGNTAELPKLKEFSEFILDVKEGCELKYCPKCKKIETRSDCAYGGSYWDNNAKEVSTGENGSMEVAEAAWTKKAGKNPEGGLNEKGRKSYERENPGSDLKAPSKKVGNPRRKSFCARMKGMKKKLTSAKTANDPDSRINKSLRAWNC